MSGGSKEKADTSSIQPAKQSDYRCRADGALPLASRAREMQSTK